MRDLTPLVRRCFALCTVALDCAVVVASDESATLWRDAIDPEIHNDAALMIYQDPRGTIWLEQLDPHTGLAKTGAASRTQLDTGAANLRQTFNGPEFGIDAGGWSIFYTKPHRGNLQLWRARLIDGRPQAEPVFRDGQRRQSVLVSKNEDAATTRLIYIKGDIPSGAFHWADVSAPERETRVVRTLGVDSPRWIDGTLSFVFAEADARGQLKLHDTLSGRTTIISADTGTKSFAYGWRAPELGGEFLVLSLVDHAAIGVWRQTRPDRWERIQTITPPAAAHYKVFGSPEPFVFKGRSYVSAVLKSEGGTMRFRDSEVWVFGVEAAGASPFALRVSDDAALTRSDPETLTTADRVHVYYNIFDGDAGYRIGHAAFSP